LRWNLLNGWQQRNSFQGKIFSPGTKHHFHLNLIRFITLINECIILAGGLGTRLRNAVPNLPKCMAPVAGRPFVTWVVDYLVQQGISHFIFSLGYRHEDITDYFSNHYNQLNISWSIEAEPLGTGGAIKLACSKAKGDNVIIVNGDTFFRVNMATLAAFHEQHEAHCTLCLRPMQQFDRYGVVEINETTHAVQSFREKQFYKEGLINGGVYALNIPAFMSENLPEKFSFEKDYLEKFYTARRMYGLVQDGYFIDIGIPEDYEKANHDFANQ